MKLVKIPTIKRPVHKKPQLNNDKQLDIKPNENFLKESNVLINNLKLVLSGVEATAWFDVSSTWMINTDVKASIWSIFDKSGGVESMKILLNGMKFDNVDECVCDIITIIDASISLSKREERILKQELVAFVVNKGMPSKGDKMKSKLINLLKI